MVEPTKIFQTEDQAQKTADGFDNFVSRVGLNNNNVLSAGYYTFNLMTRNRVQLEAAYRGSWIVGRVVNTVAEDMTRAGINIDTTEGEEDIKDLLKEISRLRLWQSLRSEIQWGRLYGGALGILQIKGQKLETPLDSETVGKGQFLGIAVYDRWQLNPSVTDTIEEGPDMGLPKYYYIVTTAATSGLEDQAIVTGQVKVHHSRVIRYIGIELPFFQAMTEMWWGESELEQLWDRLIAFDSATMSSANLIERANNRTVGIEGLRAIMAAGGEAQKGLEKQFEMMREFQTNEGLTLLDKEDTFSSTSYSFAGLDALLLQFGQQLAGATGIPLVRLFGQSPAGLSATGESDIRMYYDSINSQQEAKLRGPWHLLLSILWRSTFGRSAPKDLGFTFTPLWQMSAMDKATIAKTNTETIDGACEAGLIKTSTAMKELRDASGDNGLFSNISDEEIADAEAAEEEAPPEPEVPIDPNAVPKKPDEPVPNLDSKRIKIFDKLIAWAKR